MEIFTYVNCQNFNRLIVEGLLSIRQINKFILRYVKSWTQTWTINLVRFQILKILSYPFRVGAEKLEKVRTKERIILVDVSLIISKLVTCRLAQYSNDEHLKR